MIQIKTSDEIQIMREGGAILARILEKLGQAAKPGTATIDLDKLARELILFYSKEAGQEIKPAFLGYGGFPAALCVSVNDAVVHGVPDDWKLHEGDIVGLDMGILYKGFYLDSAVTVVALVDGDFKKWSGQNMELAKMIEITKLALDKGIKQARVGHTVGQISSIIQKTVEDAGFSVVRELVGHGIGRVLHEEPQVPNFGNVKTGPVLKEGMVIAIEPMVALGDWRVKRGADGFTYHTADSSPAAHFEHTVAITKDGPMILTLL